MCNQSSKKNMYRYINKQKQITALNFKKITKPQEKEVLNQQSKQPQKLKTSLKTNPKKKKSHTHQNIPHNIDS